MSPKAAGRPPRLLLIKLSALGDVIHALPTLEALRTAFPQAGITWLVEAAYAPLLAGHPALDRVLVAPRVRPGRPGWGRELAAALRLAGRLRRESFDLVVDLQGLLKSAFWTALARSPRKVGYDRTREGSWLPLTERLEPFDPEAHAVWRYLNVAHYVGAPAAPPRFRLEHLAADSGGVSAPAGGQDLVILHPGARWATKLWPAAAWAALADWLAAQGLTVALTGSGADRPLAAAILAHVQRPLLPLVGETTLGELATLFRRARLAVTADTGPMHLAAALGTPVVALFGPTAPWRTGPFGEGHEIVRLKLECSPCFKRRCDRPRCLLDLAVPTVQEACMKLLRGTAHT
jgi:lipopolysaccharide heptosyltransferase I